jgi:hypothetical protein
MPASPPPTLRPRSGLVDFTGVLFLIVAASNLLAGIVAIADVEYYGNVESKLLLLGFTVWGIVWGVMGLMQLWAGYRILMRRPFSLTIGALVAGLNLLAQLTFVHVDPEWSIAIMVLNLIVLWGLFSNRDEFA